MIGLPLVESQAKEIIAVASKSPLVVEKKHCLMTMFVTLGNWIPLNTRLITQSGIIMSNNCLIQASHPGLGITNLQIGCSLYKLLLYEKGGHFKFHRDTEKEDGMFSTLIIQLPSLYEGGRITIRHRRSEHTFDFAKVAAFTPYFAAFYGATGNEGATLERWYQTAVIVFWPVERSNNLWLDMGTNLAVQKLGSMISDVVDRDKMITKWDYNGIIVPMIENINELRDTQLAIRFCNEVLIKKSSTYSSGVGRAIKSLITVFGWNTMQEYVAQYIRRLATAGYNGMENGVKLIGELAPTTIGSSIQPSDYFMFNNLVDSIWTQYYSRVSSTYYYSSSSDHETIGMLLVYLYRLNMKDKISTIITYILQNTERYKSLANKDPTPCSNVTPLLKVKVELKLLFVVCSRIS